MTKLFKYLSVTLLSLITFNGSAQVMSVDISTGRDPFGLTNINVQDFHWDVKLPDGTLVDAICGSAIPAPYTTQYAGHDPSVRWISPFVLGDGRHAWNAPEGLYEYRMYFHINTCIIDSAVLNLKHIGGDNVISAIIINGTNHNSNGYGFNPFINNVTINLGSNELVNGVNTILMQVWNDGEPDFSATGMELNANITYKAGPVPTFDIQDLNGTVKSSYCMGEDVFVLSPGLLVSNSFFKLFDLTAGWSVPVTYANGGMTNGFNVTQAFANHPFTPVTFEPGHTYKLVLENQSPCIFNAEQVFTYNCCESSYDATFKVKVGYNQLQAQPAVTMGTHTWEVYQVPAGNTGSYTLLGIFNGPTFNYDTYGGCFYITHTITNTCGTACWGQIVCGPDCSAKLCNLTQPKHLQFNSSTNVISWDEVPGAAYELEIIMDDPACCGEPNWDYVFDHPNEFGNISYKSPKIIAVPVGQHTYDVNFLDEFGLSFRHHCFSYKVTAICPDGGRISSPRFCSWSGPDDPPVTPGG